MGYDGRRKTREKERQDKGEEKVSGGKAEKKLRKKSHEEKGENREKEKKKKKEGEVRTPPNRELIIY